MFGFLRGKSKDPKAALMEVLGTTQLPHVPAAATRALAALRDPGIPTQALTDIVGADPAMTANLIRTANSAAFGLRTPVDSLRHALVMLGRSQVEMIVLSVAVRKVLPSAPTAAFQPKRFWAAAAMRASVAASLAEVLDRRTKDVAFTAGLLQDLALPLLAHARGATYEKLLLAWHAEEQDLEVMESGEFGWDHAAVGGWLGEAWGFPETLRVAMGGHHGAENAPASVQLVGLLNENGGERGTERLVETARDRWNLAPDTTLGAIAAGTEKSGELARLFAA
jgi:HD-like signal output (HDOD) protein